MKPAPSAADLLRAIAGVAEAEAAVDAAAADVAAMWRELAPPIVHVDPAAPGADRSALWLRPGPWSDKPSTEPAPCIVVYVDLGAEPGTTPH